MSTRWLPVTEEQGAPAVGGRAGRAGAARRRRGGRACFAGRRSSFFVTGRRVADTTPLTAEQRAGLGADEGARDRRPPRRSGARVPTCSTRPLAAAASGARGRTPRLGHAERLLDHELCVPASQALGIAAVRRAAGPPPARPTAVRSSGLARSSRSQVGETCGRAGRWIAATRVGARSSGRGSHRRGKLAGWRLADRLRGWAACAIGPGAEHAATRRRALLRRHVVPDDGSAPVCALAAGAPTGRIMRTGRDAGARPPGRAAPTPAAAGEGAARAVGPCYGSRHGP
jgi:hypothetical protein